MLAFTDISDHIDGDTKEILCIQKSNYVFYHSELVTIFDVMSKLTKRIEYNSVCLWCDEHLNNHYRSSIIELNAADVGGIRIEIYFAFEESDKAMAFKLRWL